MTTFTPSLNCGYDRGGLLVPASGAYPRPRRGTLGSWVDLLEPADPKKTWDWRTKESFTGRPSVPPLSNADREMIQKLQDELDAFAKEIERINRLP